MITQKLEELEEIFHWLVECISADDFNSKRIEIFSAYSTIERLIEERKILPKKLG